MSTLILFGAEGWLGSSVLDELKNAGLESFGITNIILQTQKDKLQLFKLKNIEIKQIGCDFCNPEDLKNLKCFLDENVYGRLFVIFTSGVIHPNKFEQFKKVNFDSLKSLYKLLKNYELKKFTYISSNSPFGFNKKNIPFDENSQYSAKGGYGVSKMNCEKFLLKQNQKKIITILRAPWFHGRNMPFRQKKFLISASKGFFPLIGLGNNLRSIVNVKDLAKASILVTFKNRKNNIYWVCESNKSMKNIIDLIKNANADFKKKKVIKFNIYLPFGFSSFFYVCDLILQKLKIYNMYIHVFSEIGQDIYADNSLYLSEFSKDHKFSPLEETIYEEMNEAFS